MRLGEFRAKTKELDDDTVMVMLIQKRDIQEEIEFSINAIDFDQGVKGEDILTLTDGDVGSYSL